MRKRFLIIVTLLIAFGLVSVSCNTEASLPVEDELVSISFDNSSSKALSASLPDFNPEHYYWYYRATKVDESGFVSGQTADFVAVQEEKGLKDNQGNKVRISGFSQGTWKFELKAYTESDQQKLAFEGANTSVVLKSSSTNESNYNTVSVVVNPVKNAGNGKLVIKVNEIKANSSSVDLILKTNPSVEGTVYPGITEDEYFVNGDSGLAPGIWYVTVRLNLVENQAVTSTLVATVYSNITTTIGSFLNGAAVSQP